MNSLAREDHKAEGGKVNGVEGDEDGVEEGEDEAVDVGLVDLTAVCALFCVKNLSTFVV